MKYVTTGTNNKIIDINTSLIERIKIIKPENTYTLNDKGNGELFADLFKNLCRFNVTAKEWYCYDGKVWTEDMGGMIASRYAKELSDALLIYVTTIQEETRRSVYLKHVANLGQLRYRNTMLQDARDKYFISSDNLDKDPYLFNCQNGTIDLKTFHFKPHNSDDLLSKVSNVWYEAGTKSLPFEKFMNEVMEDKVDKIEYLQKLLGYSLTGETREETCFILYGNSTRNGKSTLVETIAYMLGNTQGYAMNMKPETLAQKQNNDSRQASGDIARLKGCRFLNASEPARRMLFDVGLLKTLLGRDSITARHLHEREIQFYPEFKLFINCNSLPLVNDETLFTSGRINVITFDKHFSPEEQDKGLKERLRSRESISGIFNFCLEGLRKYYLEGVEPPLTVKEATNDYQLQSDKIGNFINEVLKKSERNSKAGDIYKVYSDWCRSNGYGVENKGNFFAELKTKGLYKPTGTVNGCTVKNVVIGYDIDNWIMVENEKIVPFD